jgi:peptidoglycan/xylan/chitin deacetylase (PgdA/CDA1 family)
MTTALLATFTSADIAPVLATAAAGAAVFFTSGAYGLVSPASRMWGPVISRGDTASQNVALTFDDGPLPGTTERILDDLGKADVRAAFFVIGRHAREHPDLVRRMDAEGHLVGNHTFDHLHTGLFGRYRYWLDEIRRADDLIEQIIGVRPAVFRPPMGYKHWHLMNAAADAGHSVVTWSRRARDVHPVAASVILDRLLAPAQGGDILLLHDGNDPCLKPADRTGTREAVRPLIDGLRRRGLEPERLDELLRVPPYQSPRTTTTPPPPPIPPVK